jgi:hypothetical protein
MAAQPHSPALGEELTLAQLRATIKPMAPEPSGPTVEVVGRREDPFARAKQQIALEMAVAEAVLPHQIHEVDAVVEMAHLEELLGEKESRISLLTMGIAQWRERAISESDARRSDGAQAHARERDLVRVIHQQMGSIETLTNALETAEQTLASEQLKVHALEIRLQGYVAREQRRRWWHFS